MTATAARQAARTMLCWRFHTITAAIVIYGSSSGTAAAGSPASRGCHSLSNEAMIQTAIAATMQASKAIAKRKRLRKMIYSPFPRELSDDVLMRGYTSMPGRFAAT